jgi:hypothetical protein
MSCQCLLHHLHHPLQLREPQQTTSLQVRQKSIALRDAACDHDRLALRMSFGDEIGHALLRRVLDRAAVEKPE